MITCSRCHKDKPESDFSKYRNGYQAYCKACAVEYNQERKRFVSDADLDDATRQQSLIHQIYNKIRRGASLFGYTLDLSHDDVEDVLMTYEYKCPICGTDRGLDVHVDYASRYGIVPMCNTHLLATRNKGLTPIHRDPIRQLAQEDEFGVRIYRNNQYWQTVATRSEAQKLIQKRLQRAAGRGVSVPPTVVRHPKYGRMDVYKNFTVISGNYKDVKLCL